jgi:hypothetical protein
MRVKRLRSSLNYTEVSVRYRKRAGGLYAGCGGWVRAADNSLIGQSSLRLIGRDVHSGPICRSKPKYMFHNQWNVRSNLRAMVRTIAR